MATAGVMITRWWSLSTRVGGAMNLVRRKIDRTSRRFFAESEEVLTSCEDKIEARQTVSTCKRHLKVKIKWIANQARASARFAASMPMVSF